MRASRSRVCCSSRGRHPHRGPLNTAAADLTIHIAPTSSSTFPNRAPCRLIADNAGIEGEVIVEALTGKSFETGYNAMDDRIEDLIAAGVIDPAKVWGLTSRSSGSCSPRPKPAALADLLLWLQPCACSWQACRPSSYSGAFWDRAAPVSFSVTCARMCRARSQPDPDFQQDPLLQPACSSPTHW